MDANTSGKGIVSNKAAGYGAVVLETAGTAEAIMPPDMETDSWAIKTDMGNTGVIYVGWDRDVTVDSGFPLTAGEGISISINNRQQQVYAVSEQDNDIIRYIATS